MKSGLMLGEVDRYLSGPQLARLTAVDPGARPYYRALARSVRSLILDGRLPVRVRVPAERHLADALGVSRTTVTAAYDRLREQGYLESRQGAGSWTALPDAGSLGTANPWIAAADDGLLPLHTAAPSAISTLPAAIAFAGEHYPRYALGMGYDPVGIAPLREAIAARYTERGLATRPEQILVTTGAQQAIHLVTTLLLSRGDPVLLESPTYPHAIDLARMRGARIVPVGIPDGGWHLDLLTCAIRQSAARLAYVIPDFHNPTGHLMDEATRAGLTEAARRYGTTLVADESWAELALDGDDGRSRVAPLAAFDTDGRVITIGSASKLWWGGLRIGWIRTTAATVRRLAVLRAAVDIASPLFEQLVTVRLFEDIEESRAERARTLGASREVLTTALAGHMPDWDFTVPSGGGSLWVRLSSPEATALVDAAACHGVRLAPGRWFGVDGTLESRLRLPFTQPPQVLTEAVRRIAEARVEGASGNRPPESLTPTL
ncbi:DNA-binding transcriptional MocR family regulator [Streptosporangium becharense]|uniref:DNA-binding transcriptional MocR family regulator n=1 Tax=Streptosporangium becharense TaxID=1816182 RepID=A0A7W9MF35_9ACTN|nr:PLP-dependent aminotransferase family protein [Streptosporangium becharense]MBB2915268.1 DNA-binding transcriptional MocR family regulator [Streptosporangium becharense]MBB5817903.1 DNA-binding transcriptional MocR family regulator [Streptosporangium becharense]